MDLIEDNTKGKAMSGIEGGSTTESEATKKSKSKKRCESSMAKVNPKNAKITVPSKERDSSCVSSMSDGVHRKKIKNNSWTSI